MKLYHKKKVQILHAYCICIEPLRWGWGGSWKSACHVTQRKCDGVLFSGNCSEEVVSSFSCGFIKSYLALIPIRTAFIWSYIIKIVFKSCTRILYMYRACIKVGVGWVLEIRLSRDSEKMWWCFVQWKLFRRGLFHRFLCGFIKSYLALIPIWTAFIWSYIIKKCFKSCTRIHTVCIEPLRWGWGRSGKCASHVTQRKCNGVLFSGNN